TIPWTSAEEALLREAWASIRDAAEIRKLFPHRTLESIKGKAQHMGLKRATKLAHLPPLIKLNITELEAAWLAGFIDGEGTISIQFNSKSHRDPNRSLFRAYVGCANSYKPSIQRVYRLI